MEKKRSPHILLGDVAYEAIRDAISRNQMKPGDRLSEYKVADWLKISRTPAREGLRRLESEGLLATHPKRGLVVAALDDAAIHELYSAREILESSVAAMAARFATDAQISALRHMVESEEKIAGNPDKMVEHNRVFHQLIYQAARNRYLLKFLTVITDTLAAHRTVSTMMSAQRREEVLKEHRDMVQAIAQRDESAAREVARTHIAGALRARLARQRISEAAAQKA